MYKGLVFDIFYSLNQKIRTFAHPHIRNPLPMANIQFFENNPYQENTYILYDETGECAIIDPGMETGAEQNAVVNFIRANNLKPVLLLNTHCHIDHVLGNKFIFDQYGLKPKFHIGEQPLLDAVIS